MRTAAPSHRRLSISVGVVLAAVTAAGLAVPAAAAVPSASAAVSAGAVQDAAAPIRVPFLASGGTLLGAGKTGFLSEDPEGVSRWTRYADGVSTVIESDKHYTWAYGSASDSVTAIRQSSTRPSIEEARVYDMATGAAPVTVNASDVPELNGEISGAAGSRLLSRSYDGSALRLISPGGSPRVSTVAGVPAGLESDWLPGASLPGAALVGSYDYASGKGGTAVVDLATARAVEFYDRVPGTTDNPSYGLPRLASLSPGRVAWVEQADGKAVLATAVRGQQGEVVRTPLGPDATAELAGGLLGDDWFAFGATTGDATPWHTFSARSLKDGATVKLLDHASQATQGPDGTLIVLGVTAAHGEGVYRVAVGADGQPAAELVASTGEPGDGAAPATYVGTGIPAVLDMDRTPRPRMAWRFSTTRADFAVELTCKATGETWTEFVRPASGSGVFPDGSVGFDWEGVVLDEWTRTREAAPNGAYDWKVTATPWNGMPTATATGTFTVTRRPQAHDYGDNGSPDLLARSTNGSLTRLDTRWDGTSGRLVAAVDYGVGGGWDMYDRIESVGDVAGSGAPDTVTRDRDGGLWLHQGVLGGPSRPFEPRIRIGGGWNTYAQLTGGSDLTGDGRADLVAVDKAGDLYLYKSTGSATAPFEPRKKIGFGWGIYNQLTATGQIGGNPTGDLVARDKDGVLWLYLGKGDGTFAPRTRIGGGWGVYADVVGIGDGNKDGRPDLYARTAAGAAYFYTGTGDYKVPFKPRVAIEAGKAPAGTVYDQVS
ncbi:FG-GAP repeat domain-containing protein [Streptomyces sp. NPDC002463]|uniref:FG-GAP repeat domain-containing protein n=1 Tax=Streptomyces sp. NPDC002463 TaxID=3364645 RepID=UPI0036C98377